MTGSVIQNEYLFFKDQIFLTLITTIWWLKMTQKQRKFYFFPTDNLRWSYWLKQLTSKYWYNSIKLV